MALVLILAACTGPDGDLDGVTTAFGDDMAAAPEVPDGPLDPRIANELTGLLTSALSEGLEAEALQEVATSGDARVAWLLADLMRFVQSGEPAMRLATAFERLTGLSPDAQGSPDFVTATNRLIAWDLPAWPGYVELKRRLFTQVEPRWEPFFEGESSIDWRLVTWGGVPIDDRQLGDPNPCPRGCIPALDDPDTTPASEGGWYPDDRVVFGVVVGGEALALPRNQMEIHEMVNLSLGGRRLGIPYCTLCGSAQGYLTDSVPTGFDPPVLRTSGLLSRSNKMMYDLNTFSVFDTFAGTALSGELGEAGVVLEQVTVVASTWGAWKKEHPGTRIIAEDGGIGRSYPSDPLQGRDDAGPIFPTGPVDPRLPVQELVVGVILPDGSALAFPVAPVRALLESGSRVTVDDVEAVLDGDGLRTLGPGGELISHQSYWFAWSQFHPGTAVWTPLP